jgi:membrane glycosyltransferase
MNDQQNDSSASSDGDGAVHRSPRHDEMETRSGPPAGGNLFHSDDSNSPARARRSALHRNADGSWGVFSMPKIRRISMVPSAIERRPLRGLWRNMRCGDESPSTGDGRGVRPRDAGEDRGPAVDWRQVAWRRRIVLAILVLAQTALASWSLSRTFPYPSLSGLEIVILTTFAVLFSWISFSFWTAIAGFWVLWTNAECVSSVDLPDKSDRKPLRPRTAVLVPICNEDVGRVFAGVETSYRSLAATGQLENFDFFALSDTNDPERVVEEELAWTEVCQRVEGVGRFFYRHRRNNIKRKSGNIADFLRRWGKNYDYMIVFDADSIIAGECFVRLVRLMEAHPQAGIIQTAPTIVNRETLFARVQQFASRVYGPMFSASLRFWQLGESYYWGHNAILRIEPFVKHCGLSRLPGKPPLGGEIMSHDFIEAALMGRAGWEVWLAYDLPGSYEESPPTMLDELKRDRRWCQGNLQHLRLLFGDGIRFGHRAIMAMGIMAYASAFIWAVFLILSTAEVAVETLVPPVYFSAEPSLFPLWPQWRPELVAALVSATAVLLFVPKFMSFLLIVKNGEASSYGGAFRLLASVIVEILISMLLAPLRMWYHSKFVLLTLLGRQIKWGAQHRDGNETDWPEALRQHGVSTAVGLAWMGGLFWLNSLLAWWVLPVTIPMVFSVPLSVYASRASLGLGLKKWRLLLIPEEHVCTEVLEQLKASLAHNSASQPNHGGFIRAAIDPCANAVHCAFLRGKSPKSPRARERNRRLRQRAIAAGPGSLSRSERAHLLRDAESMAALHMDVRQIRNPLLASAWGVAQFY